MAKITAGGAHEVARWQTTHTYTSGYGDDAPVVVTSLWVLRSDRKVLKRIVAQQCNEWAAEYPRGILRHNGGYSIYGTVKAGVLKDPARFGRFLARKGYIVVDGPVGAELRGPLASVANYLAEPEVSV